MIAASSPCCSSVVAYAAVFEAGVGASAVVVLLLRPLPFGASFLDSLYGSLLWCDSLVLRLARVLSAVVLIISAASPCALCLLCPSEVLRRLAGRLGAAGASGGHYGRAVLCNPPSSATPTTRRSRDCTPTVASPVKLMGECTSIGSYRLQRTPPAELCSLHAAHGT